MDSKFLRITLLASFLFMVTVFFVVLYANGMGPGQKQESAHVEAVVEEVILSGQIGDDLYGWMEDDEFFDETETVIKEDKNAVRVNLIATSVEKDLRIQIVDQEGKPVEGQFFKIKIDNEDEYKDLDRDGIIYVGELKAGEYQVSLEEQAGFIVPASPMPVKVKARVEYVAIGDISLLIKTEEEVDAMAEDAGKMEDVAEGSEPTDLRVGTEANFGIDVSRWNEEINWEKVKDSGVEYAIIRAGYRGSVTGALVEDWYFKKNVEGATAAGIPVGLYFFTQAVNEIEAVEEASMVLSLCEEYDITYPIFIDTEGAGGEGRADELDVKTRTAVCQAFCETIRSAGYEAGIYASKNWFNKKLDTSVLTDDIYIWLAEYGDAPTYQGKYHVWQYTSSGRIIGIEGRVDLNLSYLEPEEKDTENIKIEPDEENESDMEEKTDTKKEADTEKNTSKNNRTENVTDDPGKQRQDMEEIEE